MLKWGIVQVLTSSLRDRELPANEFRRTTHRLSTLLWEFVLSHERASYVQTPRRVEHRAYTAYALPRDRFAVATILRAGESMLSSNILYDSGDFTFVKLLIRRAPNGYAVSDIPLPPNLAGKVVFLADNMLATGGAVLNAMRILLGGGVKEENVRLVTLFAAKRGIEAVRKAHPAVRIFTCSSREDLNAHNYLVPGIGDYGDRFYNTPHLI